MSRSTFVRVPPNEQVEIGRRTRQPVQAERHRTEHGVVHVVLGQRPEDRALVVMSLAGSLFGEVPLTFDLTEWWSAPTWITLALRAALAAWSFRTELAGQPVFRERLFEG